MSDDGRELFVNCTSVPLSNGRAINLRALGLSDFATIEQEALKRYRRERIATWSSNADLMPADKRDEWVREAFERAEKITLDDLPPKRVVRYHPDDIDKPKDDRRVLEAAVAPYANWWMGEVVEGQLYAIWLSARHDTPGLTLADIDDFFLDEDGRLNSTDLEKVAEELGALSKPKIAGNGEAPPRQGRRRGRRRR